MNLTLIVVRAVFFAASLQLFGLLNFGLFFAPLPRRWTSLAAALALLALVAWLVIETEDMSGEAISAANLGIVLTETRFGELWSARAMLLLLAALLPWRTPAAVAAGLALALTAATGHAGATDNPFQLGADAFHLLAVGAWIGGLAPFAFAMRRPDAGGIAWRFSTLGTICVALILATGFINARFLVGNVHALLATDYGRVLLLKLILFAVLLSVAAINRFRLTPLGAVAALRRNALIESALGLAIVAIVAILGTMAPGYYVTAG